MSMAIFAGFLKVSGCHHECFVVCGHLCCLPARCVISKESKICILSNRLHKNVPFDLSIIKFMKLLYR